MNLKKIRQTATNFSDSQTQPTTKNCALGEKSRLKEN